MRREETVYLPESDRAPGCDHPRDTYDLIGHADAETQFLRAQNSGRLHHAWLITGPQGVGKATLAYRIIRHMLGGQSQLRGSLNIPVEDPVSQRISAQGHGNLFVLRRPYDEKLKRFKTEIPVAAVRDMNSFFENTPAEDKLPRIAIIDCMDDMNRNAENALLKTLEEPPKDALILLLANSPGRLLPTIRSRCMLMQLRPVPEADIMPWLRNQIDAAPNVIDGAVKLSRGGPGKALALVQNADEVLGPLTRFISSLERNDSSFDQTMAGRLSLKDQAASRQLFWDCLQDILQSQARYSVTGEWTGAFKPFPVSKPAEHWMRLWSKMGEWQRVEDAINMDKKTVLLTALSELRAA
ncbi:DNA polymerase III subunit delta' [Fretibacter rubidus]|uniref:DNA polymerase III subunit delta' n=1 Tax=Fretibacter rubidus TaxID=570162 RepID=UPI00352B5EC5